MNANRQQKRVGLAELVWRASRSNRRPPVPERYSSAVCGYWTDVSKTNLPSAPAQQDLYLEALNQLSATHRPSLDSKPLSRLMATHTPGMTASNRSLKTSPPNGPFTGVAGRSGGPPRVIGRRYHKLADGRVYLELVDVSSHFHNDHSSESKVRPATGILPFTMPQQSHSQVCSIRPIGHIPPFHYPAEPPSTAATTTPVQPGAEAPAQEPREARRSRWLHWHLTKPKLPAAQQ